MGARLPRLLRHYSRTLRTDVFDGNYLGQTRVVHGRDLYQKSLRSSPLFPTFEQHVSPGHWDEIGQGWRILHKSLHIVNPVKPRTLEDSPGTVLVPPPTISAKQLECYLETRRFYVWGF